MKISVMGVGHVGLVTAACMADLGHEVIGMDDDHEKIAMLERGEMPFLEEGLDELLTEVTKRGLLTYTTSAAEAVEDAAVVFICVGTPSRDDGSPNLSYVQAAAASVAEHATGPVVVAEKSTVPVRTGERIRHALTLQAQSAESPIVHDVVSNPEFLREGHAVADTLAPDRVVVGADSARGHEIMRQVYEPLLERDPSPYVTTDVKTAELIKHASNAFLATKISFINSVARICELAGADVEVVADAMGHDARIGRPFLNAGLGYGGSCFPKDTKAFIHIASELGYDFDILRATDRVNRESKEWPLKQLRRLVWNLADKEIAILGVAFKPGTDDIRDAPALDVIEGLQAEGATLRIHDPVALKHIQGRFDGAVLASSAEEAIQGAHAVVVCTEWDEYRAIKPERLAELLQYPVVVDARNIWDVGALGEHGLTVASVGRPQPQVPGA